MPIAVFASLANVFMSFVSAFTYASFSVMSLIRSTCC